MRKRSSSFGCSLRFWSSRNGLGVFDFRVKSSSRSWPIWRLLEGLIWMLMWAGVKMPVKSWDSGLRGRGRTSMVCGFEVV